MDNYEQEKKFGTTISNEGCLNQIRSSSYSSPWEPDTCLRLYNVVSEAFFTSTCCFLRNSSCSCVASPTVLNIFVSVHNASHNKRLRMVIYKQMEALPHRGQVPLKCLSHRPWDLFSLLLSSLSLVKIQHTDQMRDHQFPKNGSTAYSQS